MFLGVWWVLVGCRPEPVDHWSSTFEACQPPEPFIRIWNDGAFGSDACKDALIADLGVDVASFEDHEDKESEWALATVLEGAYYLLGRDMGDVASLRLLEDEDDVWAIRDPFIAEMEWMSAELGQADVRALAYNWAMSGISRTVYKSNEDAGWVDGETEDWDRADIGRHNGSMSVNWCDEPALCSVTLVHEATHRWLGVGHIRCPEGTVLGDLDFSGDRSCDVGWGGANGFSLSTARLQLNGTPFDSVAYETCREQSQLAIDGYSTLIVAD